MADDETQGQDQGQEAPINNFKPRPDDATREDPKDPNASNWDTEDGRSHQVGAGAETGGGVDEEAARDRAEQNIGSTGTNSATELLGGADPDDGAAKTEE